MRGVKPRLNHRLTLENVVRVPDGAGGFSESREPVGDLWAEINSRSGRSVDADGLAGARVSYRVIVRSSSVGSPARPLAGQVLRKGSRRFLIQAVAELDKEGFYLVCYCREDEVAA